jgi:hypothetical protein
MYCLQRTRLAAVWEIAFSLPTTEVDNCNIADVLFISQMYNVLLELKQNSSTKVEINNVQPKLQQTRCCTFVFSLLYSSFFLSPNNKNWLKKWRFV